MIALFLNSIDENPFLNAKINGSLATVSIYGRAFGYPDTAQAHIQPLYAWLDVFYSQPLDSIIINFNITYIGNEVYIEHFTNLLNLVNIGCQSGVNTTVNWYYSFMSGDELNDHDEYLAAKYFRDIENWCFEFNLIPFTSYNDLISADWPGFLEYMDRY